MEGEYASWSEVWKLRTGAGPAGRYIKAIDAIQPGDKVVLWLRVSKRQNEAHLRDQERELRLAVAARGAVVAAVYKEKDRHGRQRNGHRGPGCEREFTRDSYWGAVAQAAALAIKHRAKLLATEVDRFVRNPYYQSGSDRATLQARDADLLELRQFTEGVVLVTLLHPDATAAKTRAAQTKRSPECGRPPTDRQAEKERRRELVLGLHKDGLSPREIEMRTGVARTTVRRWIGAK